MGPLFEGPESVWNYLLTSYCICRRQLPNTGVHTGTHPPLQRKSKHLHRITLKAPLLTLAQRNFDLYCGTNEKAQSRPQEPLPSRTGKRKERFYRAKAKWEMHYTFQFPGTLSLDTSIFKNLFQERELKATRYTSIKVWKKKGKKLTFLKRSCCYFYLSD